MRPAPHSPSTPKSSPAGRVLIVESDAPLAGLYADLIDTHCPAFRVDICHPEQSSLIEDNAGGADIAIVSCGPSAATCMDTLRHLLSARSCLHVLVLIPADRPDLADIAIHAGAADVLLRAPGYLDQIAVCVRKNVTHSRARTAARLRTQALHRSIREKNGQIAELCAELTEAQQPVPATPPSLAGTIHIAHSFTPARAA